MCSSAFTCIFKIKFSLSAFLWMENENENANASDFNDMHIASIVFPWMRGMSILCNTLFLVWTVHSYTLECSSHKTQHVYYLQFHTSTHLRFAWSPCSLVAFMKMSGDFLLIFISCSWSCTHHYAYSQA